MLRRQRVERRDAAWTHPHHRHNAFPERSFTCSDPRIPERDATCEGPDRMGRYMLLTFGPLEPASSRVRGINTCTWAMRHRLRYPINRIAADAGSPRCDQMKAFNQTAAPLDRIPPPGRCNSGRESNIAIKSRTLLSTYIRRQSLRRRPSQDQGPVPWYCSKFSLFIKSKNADFFKRIVKAMTPD